MNRESHHLKIFVDNEVQIVSPNPDPQNRQLRQVHSRQMPENGFHSYLSFRRGCSSRFGSGSGRPSSNQKTGFCFARNLLTGI